MLNETLATVPAPSDRSGRIIRKYVYFQSYSTPYFAWSSQSRPGLAHYPVEILGGP
jgi:hypothetical protein